LISVLVSPVGVGRRCAATGYRGCHQRLHWAATT
jgi:hypothetical protein